MKLPPINIDRIKLPSINIDRMKLPQIKINMDADKIKIPEFKLYDYKYSIGTFSILTFVVLLTWLLLLFLTDMFNNHSSITDIKPVQFALLPDTYGSCKNYFNQTRLMDSEICDNLDKFECWDGGVNTPSGYVLGKEECKYIKKSPDGCVGTQVVDNNLIMRGNDIVIKFKVPIPGVILQRCEALVSTDGVYKLLLDSNGVLLLFKNEVVIMIYNLVSKDFSPDYFSFEKDRFVLQDYKKRIDMGLKNETFKLDGNYHIQFLNTSEPYLIDPSKEGNFYSGINLLHKD